MAREMITRARRLLDTGPDPYAHLDAKLATKLGGAIYLVGILYAALVLPLSPPSGPLGPAGTAVTMIAAAIVGVWMLRRRTPAAPSELLALCYLGVMVAVVFRASAGSGSPFQQLLFLGVMYTCAIHPARRAALVLVAASLAAVSPLLYEHVAHDFAALTASHLALTWSLGAIIHTWTTKVRAARGDAQAAREEAERHARIDALTGLGNRRALEEALPVAVADARRRGEALSVLVADLDGFKGINDTFGHQAGDDMLRTAARAFTSAVRVPDPCFRWGGDEFVALLPGATLADAQEVATRVQTAVGLGCCRPDGQRLRITAGAAELQPHETGADVVSRADAELLELKSARRHTRSAV